MSKNTNKDNPETAVSLSKQRKMARRKEIADKKKWAVLSKIIIAAVCLLVVGLVVWGIVSSAAKKAKKVTADSNYSAQIEDNGMIKGVKASDYIKVPGDYKNLTVSAADIEYTDEDLDSDIQAVLKENQYLNKDEGVVANDGDKVNIDYAGTIDGVAFDGGTADGYDLELGSETFIDDFEDQIVGHTVGDTFDVEVTFPDDYSQDATLAGKDAVFSVTLNGVYALPEFNDEFVQEHLSEYASTAEEYRQYLKDTNFEKNLEDYVTKYVTDNSEIKDYPKDYVKQLKSNFKAYDYSYFEYANSMYSSYYGYTPYSSFTDYISKTYSMTEDEYDESLIEKVGDYLKLALFCQYVAEEEGITATIDEVREKYIAEGGTEDSFNTQIENNGTGYLVQQYLDEKVIKSICERATVK